MDKILIQDLHVQAILGVNDWERETLRDIVINVTLYTDTHPAARSDDIADCVDYSKVVKDIRTLVGAARRYTVEALAQDIASLCLNRQEVKKVTVRVEKPAAVPGVRSVGVEIERRHST